MPKPSVAIAVNAVHKEFRLPHEQHGGIKQMFLHVFKRQRGYERQQVLKGIDFSIKEGEFFGIVGRNGSGKSTLLKLLAGIYIPTSGSVHVNGKLTPFIELGVGFNPELTGRENVFLNGALLGFSRKDIEAMYDDIVEFAEIESFMDQKLKNYSSGMQVRLAFSIAIRAKSDILLIDEVLAVGDALFQKKCYNYFKQLKRDKRTVVFVSHDTNALLEYCDRGVLVEKGEVVALDKISRIVNQYTDILHKDEMLQTADDTSQKEMRWGTGAVRIQSVAVGTASTSKRLFVDADEIIEVTTTYHAEANVVRPVFGLTVLDAEGQRVFTSNTLWSKVKTADLKSGQTVAVTWHIPNAFTSGDFTISPAVADERGDTMYDWVEDMTSFKIRKKLASTAPINIKHTINVNKAA